MNAETVRAICDRMTEDTAVMSATTIVEIRRQLGLSAEQTTIVAQLVTRLVCDVVQEAAALFQEIEMEARR